MTQYLRRLAASVKLRYADGTFSKSLLGADFHLVTPICGAIALSIDLSNNIEARNKHLGCYAEARSFLHKHEQLQTVQIGGMELASSLATIISRYTDDGWNLQLSLGRTFRYEVVPQAWEWSTVFLISSAYSKPKSLPPVAA